MCRLCLLSLLLLALPARAEEPARECRTLGTGDTFCAVETNGTRRWVLQGQLAPRYQPGDAFPVYEYSMIMDLARYGLPPVTGPWRYYIVEGAIYRVSSQTGEVLEMVKRHYGP